METKLSKYKKWLSKRMVELDTGSEVVETAKGQVEYVIQGSAPYILFFHGGNGGYDQIFLNDHLISAGFACISFSRPGHLRTPLSTGETFVEQADAAAALLDVLGIDKVAIHGASAGGPIAIQFAARHTDRSLVLLLTSAISTTYPYHFPAWAKGITGSNYGSWLSIRFFDKFPRIAINEGLKVASTYSKDKRKCIVSKTMDTPEWFDAFRKFVDSSAPAAPRKDGFFNDLKQFDAIEENQLPLEQINCPTLIVHGMADGDVKFTHAETAHNLIPNSELYAMEGAYHIVWLNEQAPEMFNAQVEFLKKHLN